MASPTPTQASRPKRRFSVRGSSLLTAIVALLCLALFVTPIVMIIQGAFVEGQPGNREAWSLQPFTDVYTSSETYEAFRNSVILSASIVVVGVLLGFYFTWLVARTDTPLRRLITPTMLAVLAFPMLFYGISWSLLGNEQSGLLNSAFQSLTSSDATPVDIESFPGLIFVSILKATSLNYFLLLGPMRAMSRAMEEAASMSGARRLRVVLGINLPVLAPAIVSAIVLGFILGLEFFDLPLLLAAPDGIPLVALEIFNYLQDLTPPGYAEASALALVLLVVLLLMLVLQQKVLGKRTFQTVAGKNVNTEPWKLGKWRYVGTIILLLYIAFALVLPLVQLVRTSLSPYFGADVYSTINYEYLFDSPLVETAVRNTLLLSVLGGLGCMVLALGIIFVVRRARPPWLGRAISRSTWLPWSTPGTALALGILWVVLSVPFLNQFFGSATLMLVALIIVATPLAMRSVDASVAQIGDELEEAAWVSGAGRLRAFGAIVVRLILPSFVAGWFLTGIVISGNLVMPLLVGSSTFRTIPQFTYAMYSSGQGPRAAAFACLVLAGMVVLYGIAVLAKWGLTRALTVSTRRARSGGQELADELAADEITPAHVPAMAGAGTGRQED